MPYSKYDSFLGVAMAGKSFDVMFNQSRLAPNSLVVVQSNFIPYCNLTGVCLHPHHSCMFIMTRHLACLNQFVKSLQQR